MIDIAGRVRDFATPGLARMGFVFAGYREIYMSWYLSYERGGVSFEFCFDRRDQFLFAIITKKETGQRVGLTPLVDLRRPLSEDEQRLGIIPYPVDEQWLETVVSTYVRWLGEYGGVLLEEDFSEAASIEAHSRQKIQMEADQPPQSPLILNIAQEVLEPVLTRFRFTLASAVKSAGVASWETITYSKSGVNVNLRLDGTNHRIYASIVENREPTVLRDGKVQSHDRYILVQDLVAYRTGGPSISFFVGFPIDWERVRTAIRVSTEWLETYATDLLGGDFSVADEADAFFKKTKMRHESYFDHNA